MRHLAIGDIHGCYRALTALLDRVRPASDDQLVTLGDYVDRGPDSKAVLDWLIAQDQAGHVIPLLGNHEAMMLHARRSARQDVRDWLRFGGDATLASYAPPDREAGLGDIPEAHWDFLAQRCRRYYEIDTHFFVHGNVDPDRPLEAQNDQTLFWVKFHQTRPHCSGKVMVCGHTPQKSGRPTSRGHAICIDTCAYGEGWLTCLDVAGGIYWQANEQGQTRKGRLDEA